MACPTDISTCCLYYSFQMYGSEPEASGTHTYFQSETFDLTKNNSALNWSGTSESTSNHTAVLSCSGSNWVLTLADTVMDCTEHYYAPISGTCPPTSGWSSNGVGQVGVDCYGSGGYDPGDAIQSVTKASCDPAGMCTTLTSQPCSYLDKITMTQASGSGTYSDWYGASMEYSCLLHYELGPSHWTLTYQSIVADDIYITAYSEGDDIAVTYTVDSTDGICQPTTIDVDCGDAITPVISANTDFLIFFG